MLTSHLIPLNDVPSADHSGDHTVGGHDVTRNALRVPARIVLNGRLAVGVDTVTNSPERARTEPAEAAVTAGTDLRKPVAAEQGQIIREGGARRETDRLRGDASRPDADFISRSLTSSQAIVKPEAGSLLPSVSGNPSHEVTA